MAVSTTSIMRVSHLSVHRARWRERGVSVAHCFFSAVVLARCAGCALQHGPHVLLTEKPLRVGLGGKTKKKCTRAGRDTSARAEEICLMSPPQAYPSHDTCYACDEQQRSLEDLQIGFEKVLTMSQLVGRSAEECTAASVMLDILTEEQDARGSVETPSR